MTPEIDVVEAWMTALAEAVDSQSSDAVGRLLAPGAVWRDLAATGDGLRKLVGAADVAGELLSKSNVLDLTRLRVSPEFSAPTRATVFGRDVVQAFIDFDTSTGGGTAVARLVAGDSPEDPWRVWLLLTALRRIDGAGKRLDSRHASRYGFEPITPHENWREYRERRVAFADREPEVLVVGGGHCGVILAAQLEVLGVDALLVEKLPRLGDVWRNRYHSLALHQTQKVSQFPFLPFPDAFPDYVSKDQLADWIELYATAMEVNTWTSTEFVQGAYDEGTKTWDATVRHADGTERVLHPKHIVMATGFIGNIPRMPELPALETFEGPQLHTAHFEDGSEFAGKHVLVVGAATSAHDVCEEINRWGGTATMLQRGPISIVDLATVERRLALGYPPGANLAELDLLSAANFVWPYLGDQLRAAARDMVEEDRELIDGLTAAGYRVNTDSDGWQLNAYRAGSGYYINVGGSQLIVNGTVKVVQADDVKEFTPNGLGFKDGSCLEFDAVVFATGFENSIVDVERCFGRHVAQALEVIHILDDSKEDAEWHNAWTPTAQPGLWFASSGPQTARQYSSFLALQLCEQVLSTNPASCAVSSKFDAKH